MAGCAAAAECGFSGFDTTLYDVRPTIGGRLTEPGVEVATRRLHYRTPYLNRTKTDGSASSLIAHLEAAVDASGAEFRGGHEVTAAEFNEPEGQWVLTFADGSTASHDVLIRATGVGAPWIAVPGRQNIDADELHLHLGVELVGLPNCLAVDAPHPSDADISHRSAAVLEARADYCRRYVRQLEIRGPGAFTVKRDKWLVQPGSVRNLKGALTEVDASAHSFTLASAHRVEDRRSARNAG